jgi:DNA-binding NarL/FixJ family response regulator
MTTTETPVVGLTARPTTGTNLPPHGTPYRYRGRQGAWPGCRCTKCTHAHSRACKQRELDRLSGKPPLYPGAPVIAHVKKLNAAGMSTDLIARQAGVSPNLLSGLLRGLTKSCRRSTALRLLTVQPGDFDDIAEVPCTGSSRRIRALYAMGHSQRTIAAATGLCESSVSHIANARTRKVDASTAAAICRAYAELAGVNGTSDAARRRAAAMGWRDPLWWEDMGHIDDPAFDPVTAERELSRNDEAAVRRVEIEHLMSYGFGHEQIADRMDMHPTTVRNIMNELRTGQRRERRAVA